MLRNGRGSKSGSFALGFVAALLASCGGGGGGGIGGGGASHSEIIVSVSVAQSSVPAGGTTTVTANIWNDKTEGGVTWSVTCPSEPCGSISPATTDSGIAATYTAPGTAPPSDKSIAIKATSVSDKARSGTAAITLAAILVSVDPPESAIDALKTQVINATVENDMANAGVTWAIDPESGAGRLSNATSTSVTYEAPADPPSSDRVILVTATSVTDPTHSAMSSITLMAPLLSIDPTSATLDAGGTQTFTASIQHDPGAGAPDVACTLQPDTGAGTLSDATSTTVVYHAPAEPPRSDFDATITATSIAPSALSASVSVTVSAIAVSISPRSVLIPIGTQRAFNAVLEHDPAHRGVSWQLLQSGTPCAPACGSFASSGAGRAVYTAPAAVPATAALVVAATSVTDNTKSVEAGVEISRGTLGIAPTSLDFGRVKAVYGRKRLSTTLTNTGSSIITIANIAIEGSGEKSYQAFSRCGDAVAALASCNIDVEFKPGYSSKTAPATLTITDSDVASPHHVALTGQVYASYSVPAGTAESKRVRVPAPTGAYAVGTRVLQVADGTRADPWSADGESRRLALRFWYPATVESCKPAPYASAAVWRVLGSLAGTTLPVVTTNSCLDAPVAMGSYPVVVFSHGLTGSFTDYTFLFEDLASRGYVVASVGHTHDSTAVELTGGRIAWSRYGSYLTRIRNLDATSVQQLESARLGDIRFALDEVERLQNQPDSPFAGHLDVPALAVAGHSLGGLTALQALQSDRRVRAAVVLDGVMPDATFEGTDRPVLLLDASRAQWASGERDVWQKLRGPRLAVNLPGAAHLAPSDAVWFARGTVSSGSLSPEGAISAIRDYVAAFLDVHLRNRPADELLKKQPAAHPAVEVTAPEQEVP
jgi:dienelactone hydrolase